MADHYNMSAKKKNLFRFGVKNTNGECSSIWRVWTYKNDGFLTTGRLANQYKVGFHESGLCYVGLTSELRKTLIYDPAWNGQSRFFLKWEREKEIKKNQHIELLDLWFPSSHLDLPVETDHHNEKEVIWIGAPAKGKIVSVGVFVANIANPHSITLHDTDGGLLCSRSFINDYKFVLLYRYIDEPPGLVDLMSSRLPYALHPDKKEKTYGKIKSIDMVNSKNRLLIWKVIEGSRVCIEVSPRKVIGPSGKGLV
jgi:hypothetical protein